MDHIDGFEAELHVVSGRDVDLVGRDDAELRVADLPPPLVADNDDVIAARWAGGSDVCITCKVKPKMTASRIIGGITYTSSHFVLPKICFGSLSPGRARNFQPAYVTSPVTRRKIASVT